MRLGIGIASRHPDGTPMKAAEVMRRAKLIEDIGFDHIWVGETLNRGGFSMDQMSMCLLAAAATEHIEMGTTIIEVPLRNPAELAMRLLSMHALTGKRFVAGLGAGSTKADMDAVGVDFDKRFGIFARNLPMIRKLVQGETIEIKGNPVCLHPPEGIAGGPPMVIGSWASDMWVKRAATEYDGWMASGLPRANASRTLGNGIKIFRDAGGKRALIVTIGVDLRAPTEPMDPDKAFNLRCDPREAASRLQYVAELGFDDVHLVGTATQTEEDLREIRSLLPKSN